MTKVFQLMAGAVHGGAEAFFERLAIGLQRADVPQRAAIRRQKERAARLRAGGVDVLEVPFGGMLDFTTRPALRRALADFAPQVVLSWMNRATAFCPQGNFVHAARLGGYYNLKYYRHCDHLIGNTHAIVDYIRKAGWPHERAHYLPNFVAAEKVAPVSRASLDTPEDAPLVLALGRLHPNKGFDVLIEAMTELPRFHLWLAGEGDEQYKLEAKVMAHGLEKRVHFLGWRDDGPALLAAADMFICSSRHEPLGNVVIEAWAAGKPVAAAASAGPLELIKDGETGLLVPVEDSAALALAMQKLADDASLRARLGAAGRAAYEAEFSEPRVIALYKEFFAKVAR